MRSVDAVVLRRNLGQYVNEAYYRGDEFVIKRAGKPVAALVPLTDLERIASLRAEGVNAVHALWARHRALPLEMVQRDVEDAVQRVRRRR